MLLLSPEKEEIKMLDDLVRQHGQCPGPALQTRPLGYQDLSEEILEINKREQLYKIALSTP
jgi:hypothetical protein